MQYWSTFLTELEELQRLEELKRKNKDLNKQSVCKNCGKIFDNPRTGTSNRRLTCSEKCRWELISKSKTGVKSYNWVPSSYLSDKKKEIIEL